MSETIQYGAVGALIVGSGPSGLSVVTRHLLVLDASGLSELAKTALPGGHGRIKSFLENRVSLPEAAESRVKRELARAASPITDQVAAGVGRVVGARVGVARCQSLSNGVLLLAAYRGNLGDCDAPNADELVGESFKSMARMLMENNIKAVASSVTQQQRPSPDLQDEIDLGERPCLESFGALCRSIAQKAMEFEVGNASQRLSQPEPSNGAGSALGVNPRRGPG